MTLLLDILATGALVLAGVGWTLGGVMAWRDARTWGRDDV